MPAKEQDFRAVVGRLRRARGLSLEDVGFAARAWAAEHPGEEGVSLSLIQKRLAPGNEKPPTPRLLEALAAALEVEPQVFPEYRLWEFQRQFIPGEVGLDQALENLRAYGEAEDGEAKADAA